MAIISANDKAYRHYSNSQFRYAITYVLITVVALLILNYYISSSSQNLFNKSKESSMLERCLLAADEISNLEVISASASEATLSQIGNLNQTHFIVTDKSGMVIYDSQASAGYYALFPEIIQALRCNDVFSSNYHDGEIESRAASPVVSYGAVVGCVYMAEQDFMQGAMIRSLQYTLIQISVILIIIITLFALAYSSTFSARLRQIMNSLRVIQQGDFSHKVKVGGHDELTFLGDEFNDLTEKLQTSEEKRSRFVSDASHELKTPLASIKLLTDSILQNDMDPEIMREFVGDIGEEAERLNRTTEKLLSLTRVDGQVSEVTEINRLTPTVERVVRMLRPLADRNNVTITLDVESDSSVLISEDDLYQIAFNLVENGIKYNQNGGVLTVQLFRKDDNQFLAVSDTGVGIPEEAIGHVFERFYRVDKARSRATGGSGLGLSIVLALVRRNRGEIHVASQVGKGTSFTVSFPVFDTEEIV